MNKRNEIAVTGSKNNLVQIFSRWRESSITLEVAYLNNGNTVEADSF